MHFSSNNDATANKQPDALHDVGLLMEDQGQYFRGHRHHRVPARHESQGRASMDRRPHSSVNRAPGASRGSLRALHRRPLRRRSREDGRRHVRHRRES